MIRKTTLLLVSLLLPPLSASAELTGRLSMAGLTADPAPGDYGGANPASSDQQTLRLMGDGEFAQGQWELHYRTVRLSSALGGSTTQGFTGLFRADPLGGDLLGDDTSATHWYQEVDRLAWRRNFGDQRLTIGRTPISWGAGRFWQPNDLFGSFSPTELDTEYKPGVDQIGYDLYPGPFSSLSLVYVFAPLNDTALEDSQALHYRRPLGELSELSMTLASVLGNGMAGGALESSFAGMGARFELALWDIEGRDGIDSHWIAGVDYQFDNGTFVVAEFYQNSVSGTTSTQLATAAQSALYQSGSVQQLGRNVLGVSAGKDLTPLLRGDYALFYSPLSDAQSLLHQLTFTYSVSNESDATLSLMQGSGAGLNALGLPQSEYGHLPHSMTLRVQFYF